MLTQLQSLTSQLESRTQTPQDTSHQVLTHLQLKISHLHGFNLHLRLTLYYMNTDYIHD